MTALKKYQRLECTGLWREAPPHQRREVLVQFGDATLILSDPKSNIAISHWSLPAVERVNPGTVPALYTPGSDATETLELSDPEMIAALETVQSAVRSAVPRPGRLRAVLFGGATLVILGLAALWLPVALITHTASVIPTAQRAEIGQRALDDLTRLTGNPCDNQLGLRALAGVAERVFGPVDTPILYVMPAGIDRPLHLPGDVIVLPRSLIETSTGPEAAAGAALVEGLRAKATDPMISLLTYAGLRATFQLLTTGDLPEAALTGYGAHLMAAVPEALPDQSVLPAFKTAQIPASAYAFFLDPAGAATAGLIAGDPYKGLSPTPLVPDDDWVALQSLCAG